MIRYLIWLVPKFIFYRKLSVWCGLNASILRRNFPCRKQIGIICERIFSLALRRKWFGTITGVSESSLWNRCIFFMFGVCPEVNSKISYAGTAAYMFHVKQLPGISQSFWLLDAGTFLLWSGNTFYQGKKYQRLLNVSRETDHRHWCLVLSGQMSKVIDAESRTIELPSQFSLRSHEVPASLR